jgi:hypothetical protein
MDETMNDKITKKLHLGSIEDEVAACRKAFANVKVGALALHCHHEALFETLTEKAENRIAYILSSKPLQEQALRLRLFRPVNKIYQDELEKMSADYIAKRTPLDVDYKAKRDLLDVDYKAKRDLLDVDYKAERAPLDADYKAKYDLLDADYMAKCDPLHSKICIPECPWNGTTIFPKG